MQSVNTSLPIVYPSFQNLESGWNMLPQDLSNIIFTYAGAENLPSLALTCKNWSVLADNKEFRENIRPAGIFGTKEWKETFDVNAGEEPILPRCAYAEMKDDKFQIILVPEKVKDEKDEINLYSKEGIDKLLKKTKKLTLRTNCGFISNSFKIVKPEKTHWLSIAKDYIDGGDYYNGQFHDIAKRPVSVPTGFFGCDVKLIQAKKGEDISRLIDTIITRSIRYITEPVYGQKFLVVKEKRDSKTHICIHIDGKLLCVGHPENYSYENWTYNITLAKRYFASEQNAMEICDPDNAIKKTTLTTLTVRP